MNTNPRYVIFGVGLLFAIGSSIVVGSYLQSQKSQESRTMAQSNQIIITEPPISGSSNLQLRTFTVISLTPTITPTPQPTLTRSPTNPVGGPQATNPPAATLPPGSIPVVTLARGGETPGLYCIDDANASGCDDKTAFLVPKATGGAAGSCGTVIEQVHKIIAGLPQEVKYGGESSAFPEGKPRDKLSSSVTSSCYPQGTGTYQSGYLSTYLIIDSFNLAGFNELSKTNPQHVTADSMLAWWKSAPGYTFIPYDKNVMQEFGSGQRNLSGCVMFIRFPSGVFPSIVNSFQITNAHGDGVLSVLMSNAIFYLDRFIVAGWDIQNTLEHSAGSSKPTINGVEGFGCHT